MPCGSVTRPMVEESLLKIQTLGTQTAPIYSALKVNGIRMSDLARQGIDVTPRTRDVVINHLELTEFANPKFKIGKIITHIIVDQIA